jgi:hypothetical protein
MPARDGTGPRGTGPIGRGLGPCGAGMRGYGRVPFGWRGYGRGYAAGPGWGFRESVRTEDPKAEGEWLTAVKDGLRDELARVKARLAELGREADEE